MLAFDISISKTNDGSTTRLECLNWTVFPNQGGIRDRLLSRIIKLKSLILAAIFLKNVLIPASFSSFPQVTIQIDKIEGCVAGI